MSTYLRDMYSPAFLPHVFPIVCYLAGLFRTHRALWPDRNGTEVQNMSSERNMVNNTPDTELNSYISRSNAKFHVVVRFENPPQHRGQIFDCLCLMPYQMAILY